MSGSIYSMIQAAASGLSWIEPDAKGPYNVGEARLNIEKEIIEVWIDGSPAGILIIDQLKLFGPKPKPTCGWIQISGVCK